MTTTEDVADYLAGRLEEDKRASFVSDMLNSQSDLAQLLTSVRAHSVAITRWSAPATNLALASYLIGVEVVDGRVRPISWKRVMGYAVARCAVAASICCCIVAALTRAQISWEWQRLVMIAGALIVAIALAATFYEWRGPRGTVLEAASSGFYTYGMTMIPLVLGVVLVAVVEGDLAIWMTRRISLIAAPCGCLAAIVGLERGFGFRARLLLGQISFSDVSKQLICLVSSFGIYFWFVARNSEDVFNGPWWQNIPPVVVAFTVMAFRQATVPGRVTASWRQVRVALVVYPLLICIPAAPWVVRKFVTARGDMDVFDAVGIAVLAAAIAADDLLCGVTRVRRRILGISCFARLAIGASAGYCCAFLLTRAFPAGLPVSFGLLAAALVILGATVGNTSLAFLLIPAPIRGRVSRYFDSVFPPVTEVISRSWWFTLVETPGLGSLMMLAHQMLFAVEILVETLRFLRGGLTLRPALSAAWDPRF